MAGTENIKVIISETRQKFEELVTWLSPDEIAEAIKGMDPRFRSKLEQAISISKKP